MDDRAFNSEARRSGEHLAENVSRSLGMRDLR
jgi:hypothetical protein